jgi:hypothetical protein
MKIAHRTKIIGCLFTIGLFIALHFARAQATADTGSAVMTDPETDMSNLSDLEVELRALELATPLAASNAPASGNFYSAQHAPGSSSPWPPLPSNMFNLPIWPLDSNIFVLDDLNFDYNDVSDKTSETASTKTMEADLEGPPTPPGGGGSDTNPPPEPQIVAPDYGTNLFFANLGMVSGNLTGIASNTLSDVEYAIQTNSDLTATNNWADTGQFILGSDTTNWTQFILPPPLSTNNLFFRLQSELSSDGSGIPNWWELKYLGQDTNVNPYADPTGDGYTLLQDFLKGLNPNVFQTPVAPQVCITFNVNSSIATVSWPPLLGTVLNYLVSQTDSQTGITTNFTLPADTTSFLDNLSGESPDNTNAGWAVRPSSFHILWRANILEGILLPARQCYNSM